MNPGRKKVIGYGRVSTDEQALKGFSLPDQRDKNQKFCDARGWEMIAYFEDDFTGKTFDRPGFSELLKYAKQMKVPADYILFLNWYRFSRNTTDSYAMLRTLKKIGTEANAIEQWIDFRVPESKYMLAFYLTAPEVDNDRRGINTRAGMRRAMKEGRWVNTPPKGYTFIREHGKALMVPNQDAEKIRFCFSEMNKGIYSVEQLYIKARKEQQIKLNRSKFYAMLRNKLYAGIIRIPAFETEPYQEVKGVHQPLVSMEVFRNVQDILAGRAKSKSKTSTASNLLPLRGHLICPDCGGQMTGSASRGRHGGRYYYYHCQKPCKNRYRADKTHESFKTWLSSFCLPPEFQRLAYVVVKDVFLKGEDQREQESRKLQQDINKVEERLKRAEDMLLDGDLNLETYRKMTERNNQDLDQLLGRKVQLELLDNHVDAGIKYALSLMCDLPRYFEEAAPQVQNKLLGSIFPEKFIFDGNEYRTPRLNKVFEIFNLKNSRLEKENGTTSDRISDVVPYGSP